jgi:hypothetical protein
MKLNTLLSIAGLVALLFGLAFLLAPVQTMDMYGVTLDISGQYVARYLGSAFLGLGVLNWSARNAKPNEAGVRAIILGGVILSITGFIASLFDVFTGPGNNLVWSTVVIYFFLMLGYGYFQFGASAD